jgi:hypothetical protein
MLLHRPPYSLLLIHSLCLQGVTAFGPKKFKQWFPQWQHSYYVGDACAAQIGTYWADNGTFPWRCQAALDCIIGNTSGSAMQEMSSSMVLLGLTPTMLSQLGPKLSESSMLAYRRPGLSFLLSMGSPTVFPSRIFQYDAPLKALKTVVKNQPLLYRAKALSRKEILMSVAEYVFTVGAILNIIEMSIELSWRSVLSWDCESTWLPFAWVLFPGLIHLIAAITFRRIPKFEHGGRCPGQRVHWSIEELMPCHTQAKLTIEVQPPNETTIVLNDATQVLVIFHITLGTIIFSSCQFLRLADVVPVILRYSVSGIVCRFITVYELRGMSSTLDIDYTQYSDNGREPQDASQTSQTRGSNQNRAVTSIPCQSLPNLNAIVGTVTHARHSI